MLLTLIKVVLSTLFRDILVACTEGGIDSHGLSFFTQAFKARLFRNDSFKIVVQRHSTCSKSNGNNIRKRKKTISNQLDNCFTNRNPTLVCLTVKPFLKHPAKRVCRYRPTHTTDCL